MTQQSRTPSSDPLRIGIWASAYAGSLPDHDLRGLLEGLLEAGPDDTLHVVRPPGVLDVTGRSLRLVCHRLDAPRGLARRLSDRIEAFADRFEKAGHRGVGRPLKLVARVLRKVSWRLRFRAGRAIIDRADCDVWLVPSLETDFPFSADVRCVLVVDGVRLASAMPGRPHARSTLYVVRTAIPDAHPILAAFEDGPDRARVVLPSQKAGREWRKVLAEAARLPLPGAGLAGLFRPSPPPSGRRYRVRLFLPHVYLGGVWEAARGLLAGLVEVNRRRGAFDFTLALPASQPCVEQVARLDGLSVEWLTRQVFTREEARPLLDLLPDRPPEGDPLMLPWSPSAAGADAWFALVDRLSPAVLPMRPLGVLVHDVLQRHVPEAFPASLFDRFFPAIRASARAADRAMTTNPATRLDVIDEFGLDPERVGLIHVACEPHARFAGLQPRAVPVPDGFVLNVTNVSPHKGAELVLRAHASMRQKLGDGTPPLVVCGVDTDQISPSRPAPENPAASRLRAVVGELGLREGRDVWFLGYLRDEQLLDLFRRCSVVVNAARYDNGTYSLIEAHYFGKPTVCTRYPAAEALYERFEVPVHYFAMGDAEDLAEKIGRAARVPALAGEELARVRGRLADPRHGGLRYAEEVYDLLLDLCRQGRRASADAA